MPATLTVNLARPITALHVVGPAGVQADTAPDGVAEAINQEPSHTSAEQIAKAQEIEQLQGHLAQSCQLIEAIAAKLGTLYEQTLEQHRSDIAKLAVEIARKILSNQIAQGDYDIQSVVQEALQGAPTRQNVTIRVNPEDLPQCQQLQQDNPDGHFADLSFVPDWSIARADCVVETPKGIVESFVEDHLRRITDALERAQQS